jgi:uncharacterized membrane protein
LSDTAGRSLVKAVSWRITASLATFIISFFVSSDLSVAGVIASIQFVVNLILYFIHERIWNRVEWGKSINTE